MKQYTVPALAGAIGLALALASITAIDAQASGGAAASSPSSSTDSTAPQPGSETTTSSTTVSLQRAALVPSSMNWSDAQAICTAQGKSLATRATICPSGAGSQPVFSRPSGDVWMAVGDHSNAWVSVGASYDERLCKLHEEVTGSAPPWGTDRGPEPETGQATALACVP